MESIAVVVMPWLLALASVLTPAKTWFPPSQPLTVNVESDQQGRELTLILTDFTGKTQEAVGSADVAPDQTSVNVKNIFPIVTSPGTFVLYAVPRGGTIADFIGTPLVIEARQDRRRPPNSGPMVYKVSPLSYVVMETDQGPVTLKFYYDVAPNTVASFLRLVGEGYFDGLTFHRVAPAFVIQGGDPLGDGTGGPGFRIDAEFNDRPLNAGVIAMAREGDPNEAPGIQPGPVAANSAGSQFFICLDYNSTQQLDGRYTAFGEVVEGMDTVNKIAATPLLDAQSERPAKPPVMTKVEVRPVTPGNNPYRPTGDVEVPSATQPATTQAVE
jgi:cyclophilin family peptidyl-prolyl cis-trans isomerase